MNSCAFFSPPRMGTPSALAVKSSVLCGECAGNNTSSEIAPSWHLCSWVVGQLGSGAVGQLGTSRIGQRRLPRWRGTYCGAI